MTIAVIATQRGYYGSKLREPGERFAIADEKAFSAIWMERVGGKAPEASSASAPNTPAGPLEIPEGWADMHHTQRIKLARLISGRDGLKTDEADAVIEAEVARRASVSTGETPQGNGLIEANGGPAPDWVDPVTGKVPTDEAEI